jgi:hypothetical protein
MDDVTTYVHDAELADRDALTGLANRKALRERLVVVSVISVHALPKLTNEN